MSSSPGAKSFVYWSTLQDHANVVQGDSEVAVSDLIAGYHTPAWAPEAPADEPVRPWAVLGRQSYIDAIGPGQAPVVCRQGTGDTTPCHY